MADPVTLGMAGAVGLDAMGAGTILSSGGTLFSGFMKADAEEENARLQRASGEYEARQLQMAAAESRAASQRQAFEKQRLTRLALGTLQTRAAAGGGKASDENIVTLASDIAGRGEYQALADLYTGENRARGLEDQAAGKRYEGEAKVYGAGRAADATRLGSLFSAGGTILSGTGSMAREYGRLTYDPGRYG